jgi:hypothetical protein
MDVAIDIFPTRACQAVRRTQPRVAREVQPHGVVRGEQLADPQAHFLNSGNQIYVALCDGNVIGTCAVIPRSVDAFELGLWTISARGLTNDCS